MLVSLSVYIYYYAVIGAQVFQNPLEIRKAMENKERIAIVGVGCRFPGADDIEEFWRVLSKGENHVNEIPPERWNLEAVYSEDADALGKTYVRRAGLVKK